MEKFEHAIASLEQRQQQETWSKLLQESYESHIAALRSEIAEYETLKAHSDNEFAFGRTNFTVDKIAQFLIKARIAAKISPAELASLAQIPVEKITEYERNNYESASFLETGNQFVKISDAVSRSQGRVDYGLSPQAEDGVVEAAPPKPV
ncbi:MAG: hypothetical protein GDA43_16100 [Hormoscilla sp. SP5CHS1]|nr:hypothetical protein [Hormoscilla sp. SP12CHS1]MBC6454523.1 hypothetical protein [Hormoscilla sp. SP5CHS1]